MNNDTENSKTLLKAFKELRDEKESDLAYSVSKKYSKSKNIKEITDKNRLTSGIISALSAAAFSPLIQKYVARNKKLSLPFALSQAAIGFGTGYFSPDIANIIRRRKKGEFDEKEAKRQIKILEDSASRKLHVNKEINDLYGGVFKNKLDKGIEKKSSFFLNTVNLIRRGATGATKLIHRGFDPRVGLKSYQKTPLYRRGYSFGFKTGVIGSGIYGANRVIHRSSMPRSTNNYTTLLRNNTLAGKIRPAELSQPDLMGVKKLGLN